MKDGSTLKKQMFSSNAPTSAEEEDETEDSKIEEEDLFTEFNPLFFGSLSFSKISWPETKAYFSTRTISIHTPPPEL